MSHDVIRLHNMPFYGRHGVNPEEQTLGQRFEIDVELWAAPKGSYSLSERLVKP